MAGEDSVPIVNIQFDYYSEADKSALCSTGLPAFTDNLGEVEAPLPDFLTYYLYHLRSERDGWRDFREIREDRWRTTCLGNVFHIEDGLIYAIENR